MPSSIQTKLKTLLKQKGTGQKMGKTLSPENLAELGDCLRSKQGDPTTVATLITALLMLPPTDDEAALIKEVKRDPSTFLQPEIQALFFDDSNDTPRLLLSKLMNYENLNDAEVQTVASYLFDPEIPEPTTAAILEALRLKRETLSENVEIFNYLHAQSTSFQADIPVIIDLSNAYDGYNRYPALTPYIAAMLGAVEVPTVIHGIKEVGPKNGITSHKILEKEGKDPLQSIKKTIQDIEDPKVGWGYVDQSLSCPKLAKLVGLRERMVKRPVLATLEKLLQPISATDRSILITGYTHPPYKDMMTNLLNETSVWSDWMILRGLEGSIQLSLEKRAPFRSCLNKNINEGFVRPSDYGLDEQKLNTIDEMSVEDCVQLGSDAINGKPGLAQDLMVYFGSMILHHVFGVASSEATHRLQSALESKHALAHWSAGMNGG